MFHRARVCIILLLSIMIMGIALPVCKAQVLLNKIVTLEAKRKPISDVLKSIGEQGNFYFSYNSNIIKKDSLVTIYTRAKTVKEVLDILFENRYEYKEKNNYIIIQTAPEHWYITGYILDGITGEKIINASVYEKQQMISTLTNEEGYFRLRLKDKNVPAVINVNRSWYTDTSLIVKASTIEATGLQVSILPKNFNLDTLVVTQYSSIEKTWWGKMLLSSRQRVQSLNIDKFFVDVPYQTSLTPGLSTHGNMNSQVINKVSLNVFGGYSAGTNGVELGGLFNMVRKDVKYVQAAGLFNNVGGEVEGVQMAGLFNNVLDTIQGVQMAGLSNVVKGQVTGVQLGGVCNYANDKTEGVQAAGVVNIVGKDFDGVQFAGVGNFVNGETDGAQVASVINIAGRSIKGVQFAGVINLATKKVQGAQVSAILNVARQLEGAQLGLINIADTSSGVSFGLISFIRKGYHKISFSTNEVLNTTASFKLGTKKLYSIFLAGMNVGGGKVYSFGYGYGGEVPIWKGFSLNPELTCQHLYLGDWEHSNLLSRLSIHANYRINKYLAVYAGPTLNAYYAQQDVLHEGYKADIPGPAYSPTRHTPTLTAWIGWNAGITLL